MSRSKDDPCYTCPNCWGEPPGCRFCYGTPGRVSRRRIQQALAGARANRWRFRGRWRAVWRESRDSLLSVLREEG